MKAALKWGYSRGSDLVSLPSVIVQVIKRAWSAALLGVGIQCASPWSQAQTDLAQAPIQFLMSSPVKPNVFFILDDSGSMQWSYLGDEVLAHDYENSVGYRSSLCNKIYYDPQVNYPVPIDSEGRPFPAQNFTAALYDGFQPSSVAVDLSSQFLAWRTLNTPVRVPTSAGNLQYTEDCWGEFKSCVTRTGPAFQAGPAYYYVYRGDKAQRLGDNSDQDHCKDSLETADTHWLRVTVGTNSGANSGSNSARSGSEDQQNFANWFSYHRTRILATKTAVGRAFSLLDGQFRVGYSTISESGVQASSLGFLPVHEFSGAHRRSFYEKLYAVVPRASTPLRAALAKAGQLYAGRLKPGATDTVQYACQQNFALLSTDGYWNTSLETASYGPNQLDGSSKVGNRDKRLPRPMNDGSDKAPPVRTSVLNIVPVHAIPNPGFSGLRDIRVAGTVITARGAGIAHRTGVDPMIDAIQYANNIAGIVNQAGFRAFADLNTVTIIAPESLGEVSGAPVLDTVGSFSITVSAFGPPSGNAPHTNTLADVAAYYFETDLRQPSLNNCGSAEDLCANLVPVTAGQRGGHHQHMVTHTLGLGASGSLVYREDYDTAGEGAYRDILMDARQWPDPIFHPGPERVDDLWHAAVNGGGRYFNARNSEALARGLSSVLAAIRSASASAAAAATSSQQPVAGDDLVFASSYRTMYWDGDLEARRLQISTASSEAQALWRASPLLNQRSSASTDTRRLFLRSNSAVDGMKAFQWVALDSTERAWFQGLCPSSGERQLSQCAAMDAAQRIEVSGERVVNYLRGQRAYEDRPGNVSRLFRARENLLGASIHSEPLYVAPPAFRYADAHYGEFREGAAASREAMVYLAANDGMLHAFSAPSGEERWAFIPPAALPELWRSADTAWPNRFRYLLDGTPIAADICPSAPAAPCAASEWRTVLVGGMGAAGREYYALDITDPERPALLWVFNTSQDLNLGRSVGRPLVTKRRDGQWVVVLSSGYNNIEPGNGHGILYVLNAATGALIKRIDTGSGTSSQPAGLAQMNAWVESTLDNTAERVIAGDLLGQVWRFDINDSAPNGDAILLAQLSYQGRAQAITTRPVLSAHRLGAQQLALVSVATGRYLGASDVQDKSVQSVYTFRDPLSNTGLGDLRASSRMLRRILSSTAEGSRSVTPVVLDWTQKDGWYMDFDVTELGERVNLDPESFLGRLQLISNVPDSSPCRAQAQSWLYEFDLASGSALSQELGAVLGRRISASSMTSGARTIWVDARSAIVITDESGNVTVQAGSTLLAPTSAARRVSWRELDDQ